MSKKRQASTELNHDNWDSEDPKEHEEMGSFKTAPKEVLEQRNIRTAKRRTKISSDEAKKNVFSGFGGIGKMQNKSFDFLANLTNGNKNSDIISTKTEPSVTSSLFTSKPQSSGSEGIFGTSSTPIKKGFGITSSPTSTLFGNSNTYSASSVFSSKPDSTVNDLPFKTQSVSSSGDTSNVEITKVTNTSMIITTPQVTSSIFGAPNVSTPSKIVSSTTNSSPFKTQPILNGSTNESIPASSLLTEADKKNNGEKIEEKKIQYYAKLKGLNEAVSDWIKKHVDETPLCILTPIFKDYEKYLKEIQAEYESPDVENKIDKTEDKIYPKSAKETITSATTTSVFATANNLLTTKSSLFKTDNSKPSLFAASVDNSSGQKLTGFSFGINNSSIKSLPVAVTTTPNFSFGVKPSVQSTASTTSVQSNATTSTPISITTNTSTSTPFSFGMNKPFSFGSNTTAQVNNTENKKEENNDGQENEDTPPKVEYTPIVEENSVFDKRCKIFVKKDANFVDKGVGTLYIKKIEGSDKHQLLVRANTSLGNILLNLRLSSAIPTQKMGKNNVMIVCIPTPDSKPPPTSVLIRVKTSEEADELLEVLNKHKI